MSERWVPQFLGMLQQMEELGDVGSSRQVSIFSDGDGDFRPRFGWDIDSIVADPTLNSTGDAYYDAG